MAQFRFCQPNEMVEHGFVERGAELSADADLILPTDRCGQRLEAGNADPHFCAGFVARRPGYPEPGPRQVPQHDFAPGFAAVTNLTLDDEAEAETVLTRNAGHCFLRSGISLGQRRQNSAEFVARWEKLKVHRG